MTFYATQIPSVPGFGFTGGPEFQTNIQNIASGREKRNADWAICRHKYSAPFKNISEEAYRAIKGVFLVMRGRTHTFLHRDWGDFSAVDEPFGAGDGATTLFYLSKVSTVAGGGSYTRLVDKPDAGVTVKVNGVITAASVSQLDGSVAFSAAPASGAVLTWSGEFFVHVRFDMDYLPFSLDDKNSGGFVTNGSVDLIEVLDE